MPEVKRCFVTRDGLRCVNPVTIGALLCSSSSGCTFERKAQPIESDGWVTAHPLTNVGTFFKEKNPSTPPHFDPVSPNHYKASNGMEARDVIEAFKLGFNLGNVFKYIVRAGLKGDKVEDLKKAKQYITFEIEACSKG